MHREDSPEESYGAAGEQPVAAHVRFFNDASVAPTAPKYYAPRSRRLFRWSEPLGPPPRVTRRRGDMLVGRIRIGDLACSRVRTASAHQLIVEGHNPTISCRKSSRRTVVDNKAMQK